MKEKTTDHAPTPWFYVKHNWQHTGIFSDNGKRLCLLDLEDWGVTEENQDDMEARQHVLANLLCIAPDLLTETATLKGENAALKAERDRLRNDVIAFTAAWAATWARDHGLPDGHLHPVHYDVLANAGARMDDFTRAALGEDR